MSLFRSEYCALNGNKPYPVEDKYASLFVKIVDRCNAKCPFCIYANKDKQFKFNFDNFVLSLAMITRHAKLTKISFTGGEPSLCMDLLHTCTEMAKKFDNRTFVVVNSNGTNIEKLLKISTIDNVSLSRHHFDDNVNRGIFSTKQIPSMRRLRWLSKQNKKKIHLTCTMMRHYVSDYQSVCSYLEMANKLGIYDTGFVSMMDVNGFCKENFVAFPIEDTFDDRMVLNKVFNNGDICYCSNYLYLPEKGENVVKLYHRHRCKQDVDAKSSFVFDGQNLRTNFNGKIIGENDMEEKPSVEEAIKKQLDNSGFDYAVAIATKAEVEAGAACGQLAIVAEG